MFHLCNGAAQEGEFFVARERPHVTDTIMLNKFKVASRVVIFFMEFMIWFLVVAA